MQTAEQVGLLVHLSSFAEQQHAELTELMTRQGTGFEPIDRVRMLIQKSHWEGQITALRGALEVMGYDKRGCLL